MLVAPSPVATGTIPAFQPPGSALSPEASNEQGVDAVDNARLGHHQTQIASGTPPDADPLPAPMMTRKKVGSEINIASTGGSKAHKYMLTTPKIMAASEPSRPAPVDWGEDSPAFATRVRL